MRPVLRSHDHDSHDPRDIPILTEEAEKNASLASIDVKAVHAALVTETLNLADSLLHRAAKDIEAALFERVFDQLRAQASGACGSRPARARCTRGARCTRRARCGGRFDRNENRQLSSTSHG